MRASDKNKKLVTFKQAILVEGMLADIAAVQNSNVSSVIENILLSAMLPENPLAKHIIGEVYSVNPPCVQRGFSSFFAHCAMNEIDEDKATLAGYLRELFSRLIQHKAFPTKDDYAFGYFLKGMEEIAQLLDDAAKDAPNPDKLENDAHHLRDNKKDWEASEQTMSLLPVFSILSEHWEWLCFKKDTYKLLDAMSQIQPEVKDDAESRREFVHLISQGMREQTS